MKRSNVNKTAACLAAVGLLFTACSGGDDDESADEPASGDAESGLVDDRTRRAEDEPADDRFGEARPASPNERDGDAEESYAEQPAEEPAEEPAMEAPTDDSLGSNRNATESADAASPDAEGGLFGSEPQPPADDDDADARLEDNTFRDYGYRDFVEVSDDPLSTFALDVDTGSYTVMRRWLEEGQLPPIESVRPEEYVNAFAYDYDAPRNGLEINVDGGPSPFDEDNVLVRIGVQGEIVDDADRGDAALTFVVDTSGSMDRDDRLGLVKESLSILVDELEDDDTVAIVTYDDSSGVVLEPTPVSERDRILDAIDRLRPGGSTNLEAGLHEGYRLANQAYRVDGINRVVLASDGVANVGVTDPDQLAAMLRYDADEGINLVTVGFGMGNFNDVTMEQLADQGDGFYAYVDSEDEAERLFEDELTATLLTIAKDAKIQVEFDEAVVESYRLVGFENRGVLDEDFRDDDVDAGELGAGHQVTAIYDVELESGVDLDDRGDIGEVFLRWEDPDSGDVVEIDEDIELSDVVERWSDVSDDLRLATTVAVFAELMRDNPHADGVDFDDLVAEVDALADRMNDHDVDELADLIEAADRLR